MCQQRCQPRCQQRCQTRCQQRCQPRCQQRCQQRCQPRCQPRCQQRCQPRCQLDASRDSCRDVISYSSIYNIIHCLSAIVMFGLPLRAPDVINGTLFVRRARADPVLQCSSTSCSSRDQCHKHWFIRTAAVIRTTS